ncbi:hypothetical protein [Neolewinella antarctica]|uniref:CBM20 domain-containing protein n=1 Tax=Neolewinella antarctica TaxID=442734 RepID=A0ABX0X9H1_9BACT|nr:hypothetical protein [Neolewinella antarctica]NJC25633.1 hypothetical protein [Neolewinella antarctica]
MRQLFTFLCLLVSLTVYAQMVEVTIQVDMTGIAVSEDGVHVAGDLTSWSTDSIELTAAGDDIYAATVSLQSGRDIQFKFLNGNAWGTEETPPLTCAVNGNNRVFTTPLEDVTLTAIPFNACAADAATKMVTFRVDMSGQTVDANGVHIAGNFQGWSPGATRLTDAGNGIYEVTLPVLNSLLVLQYKFVNGNDWPMAEDPPEGCESIDDNRLVIATGTDDIVLPTQTFSGCENPTPTKDVTFRVEMTGFDVSPNGVHLVGNFQGWSPGSTPMTDVGNGIYEVTIPVPAAIISINYKFMNGNDWGTEEDPPEGCQTDDNNRFAGLALTTDTLAIPGVKFGSCESLTSVRELFAGNEFLLAPSISSDFVSVRWELARAQPLNLRVLDMNGRTMVEEKVLATDMAMTRTLEVGGWAPGMYFVYLQAGNAHSVRKLMVR